MNPVLFQAGSDPEAVSQSLMLLLSTVIQFLSGLGSVSLVSRLQDVVTYIVCSGTVDSLASYLQLL